MADPTVCPPSYTYNAVNAAKTLCTQGIYCYTSTLMSSLKPSAPANCVSAQWAKLATENSRYCVDTNIVYTEL